SCGWAPDSARLSRKRSCAWRRCRTSAPTSRLRPRCCPRRPGTSARRRRSRVCANPLETFARQHISASLFSCCCGWGSRDNNTVGVEGMPPNRWTYPDLTGRLPNLRRRLASRLHAKLAEDRGDVVVDRLGREEQAPGDLRVAQAFGDKSQDLRLTPGQVGGIAEGRRARAARDAARSLVSQASRNDCSPGAGAELLKHLQRCAQVVFGGRSRERHRGLVAAPGLHPRGRRIAELPL